MAGLGGARGRHRRVVRDHFVSDVLIEMLLQCGGESHGYPPSMGMRWGALAHVRGCRPTITMRGRAVWRGSLGLISIRLNGSDRRPARWNWPNHIMPQAAAQPSRAGFSFRPIAPYSPVVRPQPVPRVLPT